MLNKCLIKSVEEFSNYENKVVNGISSLNLPEADLQTEPDDIEEVPKIPETLSIDILVRNFNKDTICSIQFFNLTADLGPFFTRFYRMVSDPEDCGDEVLLLLFDISQTCAFCKGHYKGKVEWVQCNNCEQQFRKSFFLG